MSRHPDVFSRLYIAMVEAGEAAGVLDVVLDRVAIQIEKEEKIKRRVKGAMIYPTVVLVFATLVMTGMLMFLVPIFVKIFEELGGELPMLTQYVLYASNALDTWFRGSRFRIIFPAIGLGDLRVLRAGRRPRPGVRVGRVQAADADVRSAPSSGRSRWRAGRGRSRRSSRRASTSCARSRSPRRRPATGSSRRRPQRCGTACEEGATIAQPLIDSTVFPPMIAQMVKIGEETGELEKMLSKVADFYEDEVDASIAALTSIIEPLMMVGVGVMVGVIIISMYLPMFKLLTPRQVRNSAAKPLDSGESALRAARPGLKRCRVTRPGSRRARE